jgi:hypothetical protein
MAGQATLPGIYLWRDPYGAHYLVDHTRRLRTTQQPPKPTTSRLETWFTDILLAQAA